jgi:hypothetical protein
MTAAVAMRLLSHPIIVLMYERSTAFADASCRFVPHQRIQRLLHVDHTQHLGWIAGRVDFLGYVSPYAHRANVHYAVGNRQADLNVLSQPVRPPSKASPSTHRPLVVDHHLSVDVVEELHSDVCHGCCPPLYFAPEIRRRMSRAGFRVFHANMQLHSFDDCRLAECRVDLPPVERIARADGRWKSVMSS